MAYGVTYNLGWNFGLVPFLMEFTFCFVHLFFVCGHNQFDDWHTIVFMLHYYAHWIAGYWILGTFFMVHYPFYVLWLLSCTIVVVIHIHVPYVRWIDLNLFNWYHCWLLMVQIKFNDFHSSFCNSTHYNLQQS